jgi:hypothetical protein
MAAHGAKALLRRRLMKKDDLFKLAQDPRFIPGIYNYCDRWCDRCPLTNRCFNYALELQQSSPADDRDSANEAFWKKFETTLRETAELVVSVAKEQGIDLAQVEAPVAGRKRPSAARPHPLVRAAKRYVNLVDQWFETQTAAVQAKGAELLQQLKLGVAEPEREAALIFDTVEIIRWYQPFIYVKLRRALDRPDKGAQPPQEPQSDANGSVKAALIAMDRSLAAWVELGRHFSERLDDMLPLLAHLDRLRRGTEAAFPAARQFVRPGFDEPI